MKNKPNKQIMCIMIDMEKESKYYQLLNKDKKFNYIPLLIILGVLVVEIVAEIFVSLILMVIPVDFKNSILIFLGKLIPLLFLLIFLSDDFGNDFVKIKKRVTYYLIFLLVAGISFYVIEILLSVYQQVMDQLFEAGEATNQEELIEYFKDSSSIANYILLALALIVIAPLLEELEFRALIFKTFNKAHPIIPILISGLLFGLMHLNYQNLMVDFRELLYLPLYLVPGIALGIIYQYSNRCIYMNVFIHMSVNLISFITIINSLGSEI